MSAFTQLCFQGRRQISLTFWRSTLPLLVQRLLINAGHLYPSSNRGEQSLPVPKYSSRVTVLYTIFRYYYTQHMYTTDFSSIKRPVKSIPLFSFSQHADRRRTIVDRYVSRLFCFRRRRINVYCRTPSWQVNMFCEHEDDSMGDKKVLSPLPLHPLSPPDAYAHLFVPG